MGRDAFLDQANEEIDGVTLDTKSFTFIEVADALDDFFCSEGNWWGADMRARKRYIFRPKRALYAVVRRKNGRRSSDICQGYYGGPTTELICWCTYEISPTIFVHSGRSKGAIPNISRDRGEPLSFRPNTKH